jgi:DNA polymerase-1
MEDRGVSLRLEVLNDRVNHYKERSDELLGVMRDMVANPEFNPGSPKQLQEVLFNTLGFPVIKTGKTGPSTDKHVLKHLYQTHKSPFLDKLLAFRKCMTTANYLVSYQEKQYNGRLHSSFNPIGTDTTRLSSSNPNLQNAAKAVDVDPSKQDMEVSKDTYNIREVFGPAEGRVWLDADYSQLQLRIFAFVSGETKLIDAFEEGWDAHDFVACQVYKTDNPTKQQRTVAKGINFGFIFGAGENKLTALSGDPSIWQTVNRLFPNAVNYLERTSKQVSRDGYVDVAGYRLHVPIDPKNGMPKGYTGVCYKVQGLEGLIVKRAMVYWDEYLQNICRLTKSHNHAFLTLQVHDELIADFVSLPRKNLVQHGNNLKRLMERAGRDYGVATPAEMSLVTKSWDCSEELRE